MDEPTTALDVTVEAAVLDLIAELRREFDTAILYISHNLGVVARVCNRVGVMYAGEMVERAEVDELFAAPQHPYTQGLIRCVPKLGADKSSSVLYPIPGRVPPPDNRPAGCVFAPRCDYVQQRCHDERPQLRKLPNGRWVRCHFAEEIDPAKWTPPTDMELPVVHTPDDSRRTDAGGRRAAQVLSGQGSSWQAAFGLGERRYVQAVDNVSFNLPKGSTLGIVGESGCGKSTLVKTIIGLEECTDGEARVYGLRHHRRPGGPRRSN